MNAIEGFGMSLQQKHLWRLLAMGQQGNTYCTWCQVSLEGTIDFARLQATLEEIIQRHEILHTLFRSFPGLTIPLQVIEPGHLSAFSTRDLGATPPEAREAQIQQLALDMSASISLEAGPILQATLIRLRDEHHVLLLGVSAFCLDATSLKYLVADLSSAYARKNQEDEQTGEILQYADFSAWQQELFEAEETRAGQQYWLAPRLLALLDSPLPFERLSPQEQFAPREVATDGAASFLRQAEALATLHDLPVQLIFLTAWQVLLWRLQGKTEFVLGIASNGRKFEELVGAIGLFDQYLPALCTFEAGQSFIEALTQVVEQVRQLHHWQEFFNWEAIHEQTMNAHTPREPFVHAAFSWEEVTPPADVSLGWQLRAYHATIDRYVLCLSGNKHDNRLRFTFSFDAHRVDEADVQRLSGQYMALLSAALSTPDREISSLNMLSPEERHEVLTLWNNSEAVAAHSLYVHEAFEKHATQHPQAPALVVGEHSLTYEALNEQSNRLAARLRELNVSTDTRVGLFLERSVAQVIGMLGILKAGGTYVPLDQSWPRQRLGLLLQECPLSLIITTQALKPSLPGAETLPCFCLESLSSTTDTDTSPQPVSAEIHPEQLAYILYTSGSTGIPRGVAVTHANLRAYVSHILARLNLPKDSSYATAAPLGADLGNTAIYAALCSGGCLHLLLAEQANDPRLWTAYLRMHRITCIKMVPSHLSALLESEEPASALPDRCLVLGGETLSWELARRVQELRPDCRLINHYGPTESTVGVLTYEVKANEAIAHTSRSPRTASVPLGTPLPHAQIYILDAKGEPLPAWETGEIFLGGAGLARGYDERADLTAERFLPNPWNAEVGGRLYRTGDRGRWLPDGTLEFLGRADRQVKLRGFRIELGEVEAALRAQAGIRECLVECRKEARGEAQLVAYLLPRPGLPVPDRETLTAALQLRLPDYMIPAAFVTLEAFPLTPTGKIDHQALPAPNQQALANADYKPPRTAIERTLARIWEEVLGIPQISIYANFFALGGDSILSIRIIARAAQAGLVLTPKQLFQDQTIADLAAHTQPATDLPDQSPIDQGPADGEVALTPIQHWFFGRQLRHPWHYNQAVLLQMHTPLKVEILERVARALLLHHDALRLQFRQTPEGWQQSYGTLPEPEEQLVEQVDLSTLPEEERSTALTAHAERVQGSFQLEQGPLLKLVLFDLGEQRARRLLLVIHHLAVDGVSWSIILEDLKTACAQVSQGEIVRLPAKTSSYQQWAKQLQRYAHNPQIEQQISYWSTRLKNTTIEQAKEAVTGERVNIVRGTLEEEETRALLQEVPPVYQTQINEVLLTALGRTLARWSGKQMVRIDMEGHGREDIGEAINVSRTVGWFTTLYPVVLEVAEHEEIGHALKHVKEQVRSIPRGGLDYGVLRYLRQDEKTEALRTHSWDLIRLNYLGQMDQAFQQQGWWQLATEDSGPQQSHGEKRPYRLEINALTTQGRFYVNWNYSESYFEQNTVETLNKQFLSELRAIITHCHQPDAGGYTPSDFPDVTLSQSDLDELFAEIHTETGTENEWL